MNFTMNLQDRQDPSVVQITCIAGELASLGVIEASETNEAGRRFRERRAVERADEEGTHAPLGSVSFGCALYFGLAR